MNTTTQTPDLALASLVRDSIAAVTLAQFLAMPVDRVLNEKVWDRMMEACFGSRVEPSVENWSLIYEAVKA